MRRYYLHTPGCPFCPCTTRSYYIGAYSFNLEKPTTFWITYYPSTCFCDNCFSIYQLLKSFSLPKITLTNINDWLFFLRKATNAKYSIKDQDGNEFSFEFLRNLILFNHKRLSSLPPRGRPSSFDNLKLNFESSNLSHLFVRNAENPHPLSKSKTQTFNFSQLEKIKQWENYLKTSPWDYFYHPDNNCGNGIDLGFYRKNSYSLFCWI